MGCRFFVTGWSMPRSICNYIRRTKNDPSTSLRAGRRGTRDEPREYCGLFGIIGHKQASWLSYLGLYAQQHRGQEACGIVVNNKGVLTIHKGMGLVNDVFN